MEQENKLYMNGQEVVLKNPGTAAMADFLTLSKAMSDIPKDVKDEEFMKHFSKEAIDASVRLINLTVKKTFKEITEEIDEWAMENAILILPKVIELCSPKNINHEQQKKERLLERLNDKKSD